MHTRGGERNGGLVERVQRDEGARGVEAALTGLGSAGIRALQILFVREPAAGIATEGSSALLRVTFAVSCAFWAAFWPTSQVHGPGPGSDLGPAAKGVDEPVHAPDER